MYKIGIIGSGPERLGNHKEVRRSIGRLIDHLSVQYGEDDVVFNINGDIGVGLWSAWACVDQDYRYHLFLPYSIEKTIIHWYDDQKISMREYYGHAHSLTICHQDSSCEDESYNQLIDASNFVVCFWAGNKQGKVFDAIKHALATNKIVLDGFNDLRLMTNHDVRKNRKIWKKE